MTFSGLYTNLDIYRQRLAGTWPLATQLINNGNPPVTFFPFVNTSDGSLFSNDYLTVYTPLSLPLTIPDNNSATDSLIVSDAPSNVVAIVSRVDATHAKPTEMFADVIADLGDSQLAASFPIQGQARLLVSNRFQAFGFNETTFLNDIDLGFIPSETPIGSVDLNQTYEFFALDSNSFASDTSGGTVNSWQLAFFHDCQLQKVFYQSFEVPNGTTTYSNTFTGGQVLGVFIEGAYSASNNAEDTGLISFTLRKDGVEIEFKPRQSGLLNSQTVSSLLTDAFNGLDASGDWFIDARNPDNIASVAFDIYVTVLSTNP